MACRKEAYEAVLEGGGAVVDKLLTLLTKKVAWQLVTGDISQSSC